MSSFSDTTDETEEGGVPWERSFYHEAARAEFTMISGVAVVS